MGGQQSKASTSANGMAYSRPPSYTSDKRDTFVSVTGPAEEAMPLYTEDAIDLPLPSNIVLVGSIGSGKSTIINMLADGSGVSPDPATTSNGALGCTTRPTCHTFQFQGGKTFKVWDTPGLDGGPKSTVPNEVAIGVLHNFLLNQLAEEIEGIGLLLFCVHRGLVTESVVRNLKLVHEVFCQKEVPICLVVTGLEEEENPRSWWMRPENRAAFSNHGILLNAVACVAATKGKAEGKGKGYVYEKEYEQGKKEVQEAILRNYLSVGWQPRAVEWMRTHPASAGEWCMSFVNKEPLYVVDEVIKAKLRDIGFSREQAEELPRRLAATDIANQGYRDLTDHKY